MVRTKYGRDQQDTPAVSNCQSPSQAQNSNCDCEQPRARANYTLSALTFLNAYPELITAIDVPMTMETGSGMAWAWAWAWAWRWRVIQS
jgi:hypothetical protein